MQQSVVKNQSNVSFEDFKNQASKNQETQEKYQKNAELFADNIKQTVQLKYTEDDKLLTLETVKQIIEQTALNSFETLIQINQGLIEIRRKEDNFKNLGNYIQLTFMIFEQYSKLLGKINLFILEILKVEEELYLNSRNKYEKERKLNPMLLRDLTWHFMAEFQATKILTKEQLKEYFEFQCEQIKEEYGRLKQPLSKLSATAKKIIISARVDDLAFFKFDISEYDIMKSSRNFIDDEDFKNLQRLREATMEETVSE